MAPSSKSKKGKGRDSGLDANGRPAKIKRVKEVVFDADARKEYLTGFSKRKKAKQTERRNRAIAREKDALREMRTQVREKRKEQAAHNVRLAKEAYGDADGSGQDDDFEGLESGSDGSGASDSDEEEQTYEAPDGDLATVVVEPLSLSRSPTPEPLPSTFAAAPPSKPAQQTSKYKKRVKNTVQARPKMTRQDKKDRATGGKKVKKQLANRMKGTKGKAVNKHGESAQLAESFAAPADPLAPSPAQSTVTVSGLAPTTTSQTLEHFFSFCGKLTTVDGPSGGKATIYFAKESAARTALMLSGATLDDSTIEVTSESVERPESAKAVGSAQPPAALAEAHEDIEQEDKPHTAKVAEYLAHGYVVGDQAIHKAIEADSKYGVSSRFLSFFNKLKDTVTHAASPHVERAQAKLADVDEQKGLSLKAKAAGQIGANYYRQALSSPLGSRVASFYTSVSKQAVDIHEEALRIAQSKKQEAGTGSSSSTGATTTDKPVSLQNPADAPLPSTGTVSSTETFAADKPLESTAAPLKG
ncbi:hypothetical protein JCM10449v2_006009 [Rhodotorula kratochvilovae]